MLNNGIKQWRWAAAMAAALSAGAATAGEQRVYGWLEMATIEPWGVAVKAKLDSGALTSSMHAENIEEFIKDGEEWVRFTVDVEDEYKDKEVSKTFEMPIKRNLKLRGAGGVDHRPVVLMKVCLGDTVYEEQFSLRNREKMNYPVLLGRRTIQSLGLIDVSTNFLHKPRCDKDSEVIEYAKKEYDEDIGI
ncbi:ATP-dependent zinc protease [Spongiibacter taiwanensis]|uniref:retropepsin-like aspartic peptidase RloA3 n=1 Tax=Spongiibacter taiwanensis TaxID=1748242 RepID=UPI002035B678|nr:ATP-dependent zinc protease [Spongiibacter taiwanensis]USA42215.1 ATP-dependent zinc protease [Spongiibacter taiwanensis]